MARMTEEQLSMIDYRLNFGLSTHDDAILLRQEIDRRGQQFANYLAGNATIRDIAIENGAITLEAGTELVLVMAAQMLAVLDENDAENYVEMDMRDDAGSQVLVTIRRGSGKTPGEMKREADVEIVRLNALAVDQCNKLRLAHEAVRRLRHELELAAKCGGDYRERFQWALDETKAVDE